MKNQGIHFFSVRGRYFAYHIDSTACVELDSLASQWLPAVVEGATPPLPEALIGRYSPEAVDACAEQCCDLLARGPFSKSLPPYEHHQQQELLAATLHISHQCNLACRYCYADTGSFGKDRKLMKKEVVFKALDFVFAQARKGGELNIGFFGGEPILNYRGICEGVKYARNCAARFGNKVSFSLTSNATLLTEDIMKMLSSEKFSLIFSLDGPPEIHDRMRQTRSGAATQARVLQNVLDYQRQFGDEFTVRGTFTAITPEFSQQVVYLNEQGFKNVSVEPAQLDPSHPGAIVTPEQIAQIKEEYEHLAEIFLAWFDQGSYLHFFHFDDCLRRLLKPRPKYTECGAGGGFIAIIPDGRIFPCFEAVMEDRNCIGHIDSGFDPVKRAVFQRMYVGAKDTCRSCWLKHACGGGCHAFNIRYNGTIDKPYEPQCEFLRHRHMTSAWLLSEINARGKEAVERLQGYLGIRSAGKSGQ
jgi:uncharacterized protein